MTPCAFSQGLNCLACTACVVSITDSRSSLGPAALIDPMARRMAAFTARYVVAPAIIIGGGYSVYEWRQSQLFSQMEHTSDKPHVVVLGTGWGATSLVAGIDSTKYQVSIVSPRNYFLLTPFLPSSAVGTVQFKTCMESIRKVLLRRRQRVKYFEASATDIDYENNVVECEDPTDPTKKFNLQYDHLVIAVGADNQTFGTKGVYEHANFLKSMEDAILIKRRILQNFETAALPSTSEEDRRRLLHTVIVGGGPTGVEFAAELHDFIKEDLSKYFHQQCKKDAKISIVAGGSAQHILNAFSVEISKYVEAKFSREGIDIYKKTRVSGLDKDTIDFLDTRTKEVTKHPHGLVVWATGITTKPLIKNLIAKLGDHQKNSRALSVDGCLKTLGCRNVYCIGDACTIKCNKLEALLDTLWHSNERGMTLEGFQKFVEANKRSHPQLEFLGCRMAKMFRNMDTDADGVLCIEVFKALLQKADSKITALPPTAQVAAQQGSYLAQHLNTLGSGDCCAHLPFEYNHLGTFSYVGGNTSIYDSDSIKTHGGGVFWARNTAYLGKLVCWETQKDLFFDLFWSKWFGRDIAQL